MATPLSDPDVARALGALPNELNELGYDSWGFHPGEARALYSLGRRVFDYFRTEVHGIEHLPAGRVLLVPNHAGQLPLGRPLDQGDHAGRRAAAAGAEQHDEARAAHVLRAAGVPGEFLKYPCVLTDEAFREAFGWAPRVGIREALASTTAEARR